MPPLDLRSTPAPQPHSIGTRQSLQSHAEAGGPPQGAPASAGRQKACGNPGAAGIGRPGGAAPPAPAPLPGSDHLAALVQVLARQVAREAWSRTQAGLALVQALVASP